MAIFFNLNSNNKLSYMLIIYTKIANNYNTSQSEIRSQNIANWNE